MKRTNEDWLQDLQASGPIYDDAVNDLRDYLFRVVCTYLCRHRSDLAHYDRQELEQMAEDMAQDALLAVLNNLASFRGDSRFTTWAFQIGINAANAELKHRRWRNVSLDATLDPDSEKYTLRWLIPDRSAVDPVYTVEQRRLWAILQEVIQEVLTERQQFVLINHLFRRVPTDVIAEELGTNRNNIYKITHDARIKLRNALIRRGITHEYIAQIFAEGQVELGEIRVPTVQKEATR